MKHLSDKVIDILLEMKSNAIAMNTSDNANYYRSLVGEILRLKDGFGEFIYDVEIFNEENSKIPLVITACDKKILNIKLTKREEDALLWFMGEGNPWNYYGKLIGKYKMLYKEITGETYK